MKENNIKIELSRGDRMFGYVYYSDNILILCGDFVKKKLGKEPLMVSLSLSTKDNGGEIFSFGFDSSWKGYLCYREMGVARPIYAELRKIILAAFCSLPDEKFELFVKVEELS